MNQKPQRYQVKVPKKSELPKEKKFNPRYFNRQLRKLREDVLRG